MYLSVIIPAKNEAKNIGKTLESVFNYLTSKGIEHEILVVTNRSTDKTASIVNELKSQIPTLELLDYPNNGGKGFAVKEGMLKAKGDFRLFMDADNATTIDHIEKMMPYFSQGYDVVIGSIRAKGFYVEKGSEPWYRIFLGRLAGLYTRIVLLPGILDTQRGFKIVSAKAGQEIFSRSKITQFGFDMEMLALARMLGYKIKEVPVRWHNDPNTESHPRLSAYIQVLLDTLRIKRDLLLGRYK
ncbi:MAG: dolichyl-phosphate beta-glucosyltransferase [Patescibacteria group bacterium]